MDPSIVASYLDAIHRGDRLEAVAIVIGLLERGEDPESIIIDVLATAQREIGRKWEQAEWSVSLEHRASSITESALQALTDTAMHAPGAIAEGSAGRAVVACSEGEWHVLPGRMASEVLRLRGADVSFVGPSVPADDLAEMLGENPPSAVAITCSMPVSLTGAWRTITAMREMGMTIVCGGRGFGPEGRWGLTLGADLWAEDFSLGADLLLASIQNPNPPAREPVGEPEILEEIRTLRRNHDTFVEAAMRATLDRLPGLRADDNELRAARDDVTAVLHVIASAALVGDPVILTDYVDWAERVRSARDQPLAHVATAFSMLIDELPAGLEITRSMAMRGLEQCTAAPLTS